MAKRKAKPADDGDDDDDDDVHMHSDDSDASSSHPAQENIVDVDFEFFDPNPAIDYHAIKRLLTQLFGGDPRLAPHTHDLTELILAQPLVGTTVKTDGREADPMALLTVLNMHTHNDRPSIKALAEYALNNAQAAGNTTLHDTLSGLLAHDAQQHLGLVLSERLINMPAQVVPPMYRMLADEIAWAVDDNEPYTFSHLLFLSRTYALSAEEEEALRAAHPSKRQKVSQNPVPVSGGIYPFHPEDMCIAKLASHVLDYPLTPASEGPREKDAFGLDVRGRLALVPASRLAELVHVLGEEFAAPGAAGSEP